MAGEQIIEPGKEPREALAFSGVMTIDKLCYGLTRFDPKDSLRRAFEKMLEQVPNDPAAFDSLELVVRVR